MKQVYTVDQSLLNNISKRAFIRALKIMGITFGVMLLLMYPQRQLYFQSSILIAYVPGLLLVILPAFMGSRKVKDSARTLEIIVDDEGVQRKAQMSAYKNIAWANMIIEEKKNGTINLYDNSVASFIRKWNGKGWISIPPEINDRNTLLNELTRRAGGSLVY